MNKEILKFMSAFFAEKEAWVAPGVKIPTDTDGFEFKQKTDIKGLVVFGKSYPLSNQDVSIDDHLKVWYAIKSAESCGIVFEIDGQKLYVSRDINVNEEVYKRFSGRTLKEISHTLGHKK